MNRLRMIRKLRGISQRELGKAAGLSATAISRYETGERKLTVETAQKMAAILHTDWVSLFDNPIEIPLTEGENKVEK